MAEQTAPELGLRELKKRQTLFALCQAARRLAAERGLDATTTDDIAKAVGVSPRTFFNYYETKLDAVVGPVGEIGTPSARAEFIAGGPTGVLIDDLTRLFASTYEPEAEVRETVSLVADLIKSEPRVLAGFFAAGLKHEVALGELLHARLGDAISPEFISLTAGLMTTLTTRAAMSLAGDTSMTLAQGLDEHCRMAARLFERPPAQGDNR
ncbi:MULTISPECIES: TetR/AcrR family transcriptional regulator [unclassified Nocardia]|uniref:TetR/AcrR family transcriptional regulator n=1 Tax=unclassified Nocardia TaxID=2637762 RepID=UPI001CE4A5ED|nr:MULTISPECIES: TetR/AcrR family transcriptional regulator [unclassified Nocardia]